jgi:hypothetical protein
MDRWERKRYSWKDYKEVYAPRQPSFLRMNFVQSEFGRTNASGMGEQNAI